ncbi:hypothetical protein LCGC14_2481650, partial [marine sediment metagenome]
MGIIDEAAKEAAITLEGDVPV